jgi:hypothetical protein
MPTGWISCLSFYVKSRISSFFDLNFAPFHVSWLFQAAISRVAKDS